MVPASWMPAATMARVIVHWTAGTYTVSALDRDHYHLIIGGDTKLVRGARPISGNSAVNPVGARASHTLNCNTGSIGYALACMGNAVQSPFDAGKWPLKREQWDAMIPDLAQLCQRYRIPVTDKTLLSHAEVQANLKITQRGKWDIAILPFDLRYKTARAVGDLMRKLTLEAMSGAAPTFPAADAMAQAAVSLPVLKRGAKGDDVARLQGALNAKYAAGLTVDRSFGKLTEAALIAFQRASGLLPDGIAGPKTWAALGVK